MRVQLAENAGPGHDRCGCIRMKSEHPPLNPNLAYAIKIVHATCCLAGSKSYLDDIRADLGQCGVIRAARDHDTAAIFDWLIEIMSFQGISDAVASGYIAQHGSVRWAEIAEALSRSPSAASSIRACR
jgi:hypothetical protein